MKYHTIRGIEKIAGRANLRIIDVYEENRWVVVVLSSGVRVKFRSF